MFENKHLINYLDMDHDAHLEMTRLECSKCQHFHLLGLKLDLHRE